MFQPPLQLERSFFTKLQVEADPRHKAGESRVSMKAEPALSVLDDTASRWQIDLDIAVGPEAGAPPPPYRIHLHLIGLFTFHDESRKEEEKARILAVTGVSILYSQAREMLLMLTSRGPWGPFQLRTVSFVDARPQPQEVDGVPAVREPAGEYQAAPRSRKPARQSAARTSSTSRTGRASVSRKSK